MSRGEVNNAPVKLLVVDDEEAARRNFQSCLGDLGYQVVVAADGREGLEVFGRERADVVLTDLRMPAMGGLAFIAALKERSPDTPVIVVSGTGTVQHAIEAVRLGAWDYVIKPVLEAAELDIRIRRALDRARLLTENRLYQEHLERLVDERTRSLRASEERLKLALEVEGAGIWEVDSSEGRLRVDRQICRSLGLLPGEEPQTLEGWQSLCHPEDRDRAAAAVEACLRGEVQVCEVEQRIRHRDGHYVWTYVRGRVIERDGTGLPRLVIGTSTDISGRKQMEQEREALRVQLSHAQKMEAVGQFASGVAHDFSNLLMVILGGVDVIKKLEPANAAVQETAATIWDAVDQAVGVTRSLLTFSRQMPTEKKATRLQTVVETATRMLGRLLPPSIGLVVNNPPDPPLWVNADAVQLQQVVLNLAINARDAMRNGGTLRISAAPAAPDHVQGTGEGPHRPAYACLTVRDTGTGIAPEIQSHLFEPFFSTKPRGQGTGLGLSIVHGIIEQHEGQIRVESEVGKGSAFEVLLPLAEFESEDEPAGSAEQIPRGHGETILLAEDDTFVRSVLVSMLRQLGYEVLPTATAHTLVPSWREHRQRVRLFIVAAELRGQRGIDCLRALREAGAEAPAILVVGATDHHDERPPDRRVFSLRKPFGIDQLGVLVSRLLGGVVLGEADHE